MFPLLILLAGGIILTAGDVLMKKWSVSNDPFLYAAGMVLYLISLNFLAYSFKLKDIAIASALFVIFNILSLAAIGYFFFDEKLSVSKMIGLLLFTAAVILFEME